MKKHGFKLIFWFVKIYESYEQMPPKTYERFAEACYSANKFKRLFALFAVSDWQKKFLSFFLTAEESTMLLGFLDFFLEKNSQFLPSKNGVWVSNDWTFIQFIRLVETYQLIQKLHKLSGQYELKSVEITQAYDRIIAIAYMPPATNYDENDMRTRAEELQTLSVELKERYWKLIGENLEKIIKRNPNVFPKVESEEIEATKPQGSWLEVVRIMAQNPVYFETVAQMNADSALFNLSGIIAEQQKAKAKK